MIHQPGSIALSTLPDCPRLIKTKGNIQQVKYRLRRKNRVSARQPSMERGIPDRSVRRIMKNDLDLCPYKTVIEPLLSDDQKIIRKKFANWVRTNLRKGETMRILFSDEKFFNIDSVYNSRNERGRRQ